MQDKENYMTLIRLVTELQPRQKCHKQAMMALQEMAVLNGFNVAAWC